MAKTTPHPILAETSRAYRPEPTQIGLYPSFAENKSVFDQLLGIVFFPSPDYTLGLLPGIIYRLDSPDHDSDGTRRRHLHTYEYCVAMGRESRRPNPHKLALSVGVYCVA